MSAYSGAIRPPILALSGHLFRFNPDTHSGINQAKFPRTPESLSGLAETLSDYSGMPFFSLLNQ